MNRISLKTRPGCHACTAAKHQLLLSDYVALAVQGSFVQCVQQKAREQGHLLYYIVIHNKLILYDDSSLDECMKRVIHLLRSYHTNIVPYNHTYFNAQERMLHCIQHFHTQNIAALATLCRVSTLSPSPTSSLDIISIHLPGTKIHHLVQKMLALALPAILR